MKPTVGGGDGVRYFGVLCYGEWADLGVTHLSVRTDESRSSASGPPKTVDEHVTLLEAYARAVPLG